MLNDIELKELKEFAKTNDAKVLKMILNDMKEKTKKVIISHALNNEMEYLTKSTDELKIINRIINKIFGGNK